MNRFIKYCLAVAVALGFQVPAFAQASLEEVIVTAQRTEQSLQDVPIAVTALSSDDLATKQVITFSDLQLNVPGLNYGQTNFGAASINLRGVGRLSTGISFDQSVSYHVNEAAVGTSAVGLEQFDVARVEVLRGPQGTLFGRGATAGAINVVTNKPDFDEIYGSTKITAGNYNTQKIEAMVNVPITDNLAVRFAGYDLQRDGFIDNLFLPDTDYDGRDQTAGRFSLAFNPTDRTSINLMFENYNEESSRALKGRYVCEESPTPNRGCVLGGQVSELANPGGVYDGIIAANYLGTAPPGQGTAAYKAFNLLEGNEIRPENMGTRQTHADFAPRWTADNETIQFNIEHQLDAGTISFNYTGLDYEYYNRSDTDMAVNPAIATRSGSSPNFTYARNPNANVKLLDGCAGDFCGITGPTRAEEIAGVLANGDALSTKYTIATVNRGTFIDGSTGNGSDDYYEVKFASDFDGPHNFLLGINSYEVYQTNRYLTVSSPLAQLSSLLYYYPSNFGTLNNYLLEAEGIFGEYYYQINDDMKLTIGGRYADETKTSNGFRTTYYMGTNINGISAAGINTVGRTPVAQGGLGWPTNGGVKLVHATLWASCVEGMTGTLLTAFQSGAAPDHLSRTDDTCSQNADEIIAQHDGAAAAINTASATFRAAKIAYGTAVAQGASATSSAAALTYFANLAAFMGAVSEAVPSLYNQDETYKIPGWPAYQANEFDYETTSGRIVFDWQYDDNSMMYASFARGVKPAGVNPPANPRVYKPCSAGSTGGVSWSATTKEDGCVDIPANTKKEVADTFELGVKTDLLDGQLRVNANVFTTDYTDLQIASVVAATTYNFNSDAEIFGAELEMTYLPEWDSNLRIDFMLSLLDTEITSDDTRINPFNKLGIGTTNDISATHHEIKCTAILYESTACVGNNFVVAKQSLTDKAPTALGGNNDISLAEWLGNLGTAAGGLPSYGDRNCYSKQSDCTGTFYDIATITGAPVPLKGNSLPQSPEFSGNISASYTFNMANGYTLIPTASYYFQDESFSTEYNAEISDVIPSWDEFNVGLLVIPAQGDWTLKAYARNVTDEDNITTKYNSTDVTGNFQSWQYRDPRTVGIELTMDF